MRVYTQEGIDHVEMFNNNALPFLHGMQNCICKLMHLRKRSLEADVQMIGMRGKKAAVAVLIEDRQRTHVHPSVVIGQLQPGKHSLDKHAFAGARFPDDANELIKWA